MTDPAHRRDDELVSAHLDGESSPAEAARVAAESVLQARLAEFAAVRDAVRADPPALDGTERDALLARVTGAAMAPPAAVTRLDARRRLPARLLTAAAVVVAVALLGGAVTLLADERGGGGDDSASTASQEVALDADTYAAGGSAGDGPRAAETAPLPLGDFATLDELTTALADSARASAGFDGAAEGAEAPTSLAPTSEKADCPPGSVGTYTARLAGRDVLVLLDPAQATVLDAGDCSVVATFTP